MHCADRFLKLAFSGLAPLIVEEVAVEGADAARAGGLPGLLGFVVAGARL
jgi:hypothetical protein